MRCADGSSGIGEKKREMKSNKLNFSGRKIMCRGLFTEQMFINDIFILILFLF